jgi:hypothetical protein
MREKKLESRGPLADGHRSCLLHLRNGGDCLEGLRFSTLLARVRPYTSKSPSVSLH